MDVITVECPDCGKTLRFPSEKAGGSGRCRKCGARVRVPKAKEAIQDKQAKPLLIDEEEDTGGAYLLKDDPAPPPPEESKPKRKKKLVDDDEDDDEDEDDRPKTKSKKKKKKKRFYQKRTIQDARHWRKVTHGMLLSSIGMWVLLGAWIFYVIGFIIGLISTPDYSTLAREQLYQQRPIEEWTTDEYVVGETETLDVVGFSLGLVSGSVSVGRIFYIMIAVLMLTASGVFISAYSVYLGVPNRFGTRGQAVTLMTLGVINMVILVVFRLLPLIGAMRYGMMPYLLPELALSPWNTERVLPLQIFWSWAPFWEVFFGLFFGLLWYAELSLFTIYLRAVSLSLRDHELEPRSVTLIRTILGITFIFFAFYLLSITGTTVVLQVVLRVVYALWLGFSVGFYVYAALVLLWARSSVAGILEGVEDDQEAEDEYEDDDDFFEDDDYEDDEEDD